MAVADPALRRRFVTPEGVDLGLELGSRSARAGAFVIDIIILFVALVSLTFGLAYLAVDGNSLAALWLVGLFLLRNGWFTLFEMSSRGATPGKRLMKLRVVARDGGRLTGAAVMARNAMREVEVFLPLTFLFEQLATSGWDSLFSGFALLWTGILLFFPLFNRDRLRVGDLTAGTWVVRTPREKLADDLGVDIERGPRHRFTEAALDHYGVFELQKLEEVLRRRHPDTIVTVAAAIRHKASLADDGDDLGFLSDYYAALCARLERGILLGRRRDDKHSG